MPSRFIYPHSSFHTSDEGKLVYSRPSIAKLGLSPLVYAALQGQYRMAVPIVLLWKRNMDMKFQKDLRLAVFLARCRGHKKTANLLSIFRIKPGHQRASIGPYGTARKETLERSDCFLEDFNIYTEDEDDAGASVTLYLMQLSPPHDLKTLKRFFKLGASPERRIFCGRYLLGLPDYARAMAEHERELGNYDLAAGKEVLAEWLEDAVRKAKEKAKEKARQKRSRRERNGFPSSSQGIKTAPETISPLDAFTVSHQNELCYSRLTRNNSGLSPLELAAARGEDKLVMAILWVLQATPGLQEDLDNAWSTARKSKQKRTANLLLQCGADPRLKCPFRVHAKAGWRLRRSSNRAHGVPSRRLKRACDHLHNDASRRRREKIRGHAKKFGVDFEAKDTSGATAVLYLMLSDRPYDKLVMTAFRMKANIEALTRVDGFLFCYAAFAQALGKYALAKQLKEASPSRVESCQCRACRSSVYDEAYVRMLARRKRQKTA